MSFLLGHKGRFVPAIIGVLMVWSATSPATGLRVDLNPPERRTDLLTPHWENWAWHEGQSGSQSFGNVTDYMTGNVLEGFVNETNNWSAFWNGPRVEKQVRVDHPL